MKPLPILGFLTMLTLATVASAQVEGPRRDDCSNVCRSISRCSETCYSGGTYITCGEYGVCDPDQDDDGIDDWYDNCDYNYNPPQNDCDGDGTGDICDNLNADYELQWGGQTCNIRTRSHIYGFDTTIYQEAYYEDASSCGAPPKYELWHEQTAECYFYTDRYACCVSAWGAALCSAYHQNDQCHY